MVIGSREHAGLNVLLGSTPDAIVHHVPVIFWWFRPTHSGCACSLNRNEYSA
ncbi:MAG: universal stress protein [Candidatus Thiodiazotropha sp. (ex Ustalcina ferruginea)]|nr:universal stress protein [Candidatus Thiodiazotropha sp. (ex Ustalcina ferruginea)]